MNCDIKLSLIFAASHTNLGIGLEGKLPWDLPGELMDFSHRTRNGPNLNVVMMGRATWESIPPQRRPLRDRLNVVLTRDSLFTLDIKDQSSSSQVLIASSVENALGQLKVYPRRLDKVFVIGGASLFHQISRLSICTSLHYTKVWIRGAKSDPIVCDIHLSPSIFKRFKMVSKGPVTLEGDYCYRYSYWEAQHQENQYLSLVQEILCRGEKRPDRTGTGTLSLFSPPQLEFDLQYEFPLLTTKKVFWKGVVKELLWFISGSSDASILSDQGVHIWDANGSREFLDSRGLNSYRVGDLGPVYGFQWRHSGAQYTHCSDDYNGKGVDQLQQIVTQLKNNPTSRRILMSAWNPSQLEEMALPPCHILCQFYVSRGNKLCAHLYQRSADVGLGLPFNIASYALLTCMVASVCNLLPSRLTISLGDAHIYNNHIEGMRTQLSRTPRSFPTLTLDSKIDILDNFKNEHIVLSGYNPHPPIKMQMAV